MAEEPLVLKIEEPPAAPQPPVNDKVTSMADSTPIAVASVVPVTPVLEIATPVEVDAPAVTGPKLELNVTPAGAVAAEAVKPVLEVAVTAAKEPAPTPVLELAAKPVEEVAPVVEATPVVKAAPVAVPAVPAPAPVVPVETPKENKMKFCTNCGAKAAEDAKFCTNCGAPVAASTPEPAAAPAPTPAAAAVAVPVAAAAAVAGAAPKPAAAPAYSAYNTQLAGQPATSGSYSASQNAAAPQAVYGTYPSAAQDQLFMYPEATYPMTQQDRTLRQIAFILNVISTVSVGWALIPLAWMIPMTVISWGIYKGTRTCSTAFSVCTLIFLNLVSGILYLCGTRDGD